MERRWRNRPGDHLRGSRYSSLLDSSGAEERLQRALIEPAEAEAMDAHGANDAAVLLALFDYPEDPGLIFTERPPDMRKHAGEISFPGGRPEPGEDLADTALREACEEIGLDPASVEVDGALPPVSTMVTNYKVHPFVGHIPFDTPLEPNPAEVAQIFHFRFDQLIAGYEMRRLVRRGVPFRTPTFTVSNHLIWGATARILQIFLDRLEGRG